MRSGALPRIYERVWRPLLFGLGKGGPFGPSTAGEYAIARSWLGLADADPASRGAFGADPATVLDVACGPGNVTRALASGGARVVGVDASATMLRRAVADTSAPGITYVQGDATGLPFRDDAFDAVCCFGALYLFDDPWAAVAGMARVLRPGGRIVLLATVRPHLPLAGAGLAALSGMAGVRMFDAAEVPRALSAAGFTAVRRRSYGLMQITGGTLG
jgi:ubiquinone/menaquinone biosynthesis C-methylase UbiE